ncbi:hypothetical protein, conserved [Leishmania tarentolae]|uniref:Uncharacterized protein n=1 Tax=Leishmania tarentolae TaxID=5689 RepID=A0A640KGE9_LEITA|nr:hypothetical protein, conserved [Leishmania tarentolae]
MGGYPSHDAPNFLFVTAAQQPNNGGTTEVCLIPLLRRHFNDTNRRLKDAVAQLYFDGPPNTTAIALQALQNGIASNCTTPDLSAQSSLHNVCDTASGAIPSAGPLPPPLNTTFASSGNLDVSAETKQRAVHAYKAMDQLLNEIEASFFTTTRVLYDSAEQANEKLREKRMTSMKGADKTKSPGMDPAVGESVKGDMEAPRAIGSSSHASLPPQQSITLPPPPMLRPVPCAICTIEPDMSGRRGSSGQQNSTSPNGAKGNNTLTALNVPTPTTGPNGLQMSTSSGSAVPPASPEWVVVQGRRLRCVGYLSCFSKPKTVDHESREIYGPDSKPPLHVLRVNECGPKGLDVALELIFEKEYKYMHLLEPVVFLASIMFRSQYLTSSMLQRPVHSPEVENAYYSHLQLLNIHVILSKERVHELKLLQEQLPLLDFVEEMGLNERHLTASVNGEIASCGGGAASLETTLTAGDTFSEMIAPATADGEAPTNADSNELMETVVNEGGEVAKPQRQARGEESEDREHTDEDEGGHKSGTTDAVADVAEAEKDMKKRNDEKEAEDAADSARNTTADGEKDAKARNASVATASRRARRSRRRQRRQKTVEPQDEIYRKTHCTMPAVSLYELSSGECGIQLVFDGALLARMMKLIAETAAYETVKNSFIRCDMGPLMKERRHLNQSRREAQDEGSVGREEERVMGSTIVAATVRRWVKEGLAAEEEKRKKAQAAAAHTEQAQLASIAQTSAATAAQSHPPPSTQATRMMQALPAMHANAAQGGAPNVLTGSAAPTTAGHPLLAAQAVAMGQNSAMLRMGMLPSSQPTAATASTTAATAGATMLMYVPGVGYVQVPSNSRVLAAPTAPTQAAHPAYVINPATGQPIMVAPQTTCAGSASASATPQQPPQMMTFPSMMHMYNVQQQQQQMIGASPQYFAAQAAPQAVQQSQQQYHYMMGPGGQLLMVPVASAPTAQAAQTQQQPPFMMTAIPPQQAPQMQPQQVYMNPYMMPGVMSMAAAQQQAQQQVQQQAQQHAQQQAQQQAQYHAQQQAQQQAEGQKAYQQFMDVQEELHVLRQLQQQAQMGQQAPLNEQQQAQLLKQAQMVMQARRAQQAHAQQQQAQHQAHQMVQQSLSNVAAGANPQTFGPQSAAHTPASTPPQQGSAASPAVTYNAAPGSAMPTLPQMQGMQHTSLQNMYAQVQQQQQQQPAPILNTPANEASSSGPTASATNTNAKSTNVDARAASVGAMGTIGDQATVPEAANSHPKTNPYNFAAINDDDDDAAVALAAATAAMEAIRGHGGIDRDDDDYEDGGQFFSKGQFFFRAQ